jgi:Ca-activated chloride channel family protein
MPTHGLKHDSAIKKGQELLKNGNIDEGSILLITASDQTGQTADVSSTTPVHVLAMATKEGAPIPFKSDSRGDGAFQQDSKGNIIFSKLQKEPLAKLAKASGGKFTTITTDERDINHLLKDGASSNNYEKEEELTLNAPHDSGYWLVLAALPFFAILLRKRGFLTFLLIMQTPSFVIGNIWLTPDQQGKASFDQEQYQQAACEFQDPAWQAASHFKAANYKEALSLYEKDTTADGHYNRGNTLAKLGEIDKAIKAYEMALKEYPEHEDAAFNKQLLEKMKEQNQENQQEKQEKDQDDQDDSNDNTEENEDNSQNEEAEDDKNEESGQEDVDNKEEAPQEEEKGADKNEEINPMQQRDKNLLERVPDDPGALLRRKFLYQYKAKNGHL